MTRKEIEKHIARERRHIQTMLGHIECAKSDIAATRKAIKFWQGQLKGAKK